MFGFISSLASTTTRLTKQQHCEQRAQSITLRAEMITVREMSTSASQYRVRRDERKHRFFSLFDVRTGEHLGTGVGLVHLFLLSCTFQHKEELPKWRCLQTTTYGNSSNCFSVGEPPNTRAIADHDSMQDTMTTTMMMMMMMIIMMMMAMMILSGSPSSCVQCPFFVFGA